VRNLRLRERQGADAQAQREEIHGKVLFNPNNGQTRAVERKHGFDGRAAALLRLPPENQ
jgi:hypothetical protein